MKSFKYLALVLLFAMATSAAYADSYKGSMTRLGTKMEYSFSGGVVTDKKLKGQGTTDMLVSIDGEVEAGATVSATFKKLIDYGKQPNDVQVEIWVKTASGSQQVQNKNGKNAATASFNVPDNAKKVEVKMSYTGRMGRFYCYIDWDVVKKINGGGQSGPTITEEDEWYGAKIKYSISGGKLISKGNSALDDYNYSLEASPGTTITLSFTLLSKPDNKYVSKYYTQVGFSGCGSEGIQKTDPSSATLSYTIPKNAGITSVLFGSVSLSSEDNSGYTSVLGSRSMKWQIVVNKDNNNNNTPTPNKNFNWDDEASDNRCPHCHGQFSNYFFHIPQGGPAVTICNSDTKKTNNKIAGLSTLYYRDWIITGDDESELVLDHCDQVGVMKILGRTKLLLRKSENGYDYWGLHSGRIVGRHVKSENTPNPVFKMTNCTAQPNGAIYMIVSDHETSRVFLFKGSIKASGKVDILTLKPGQVATFDKNGHSKLQKFDMDAAAKKYNIKLSK